MGKLSFPITMLWVLTLINIMNFIDGIDGLTTGIAFIGAAALATLALRLGRYDAALLAVITAGAALGFLPYNFNPAKLYLGDGGAMLLGFLLAAVSTEGALKGRGYHQHFRAHLDPGCARNGPALCGGASGSEWGSLLPGGSLPFPPPAFGSRPDPAADRRLSLLDHGLFRGHGGVHGPPGPATWLVAIALGLVFAYGSMRVGMIQPLRVP